MGNFPYPSSYLVHGREPALPAWPMRVACEPLTALGPNPGKMTPPHSCNCALGVPLAALALNSTCAPHAVSKQALMEAAREAAGVLYNHTGRTLCFFNGESPDVPWLKEDSHAPTYNRARGVGGRYMQGGEFRPSPGMLAPHPYFRRRARDAKGSCAGGWDYQWCTEIVQVTSASRALSPLHQRTTMCLGWHSFPDTLERVPRPGWPRWRSAPEKKSKKSRCRLSTAYYLPLLPLAFLQQRRDGHVLAPGALQRLGLGLVVQP